MIFVSYDEAKYIRKNSPKSKLVVASKRKRKGGKTYYVLDTDYAAIECLVKVRNCKTKDELFENGV